MKETPMAGNAPDRDFKHYKRTLIALRVTMTLAVASVSFRRLSEFHWPSIAVLGIYAATNVVLMFERPDAFVRRLPQMLLFGFDLGAAVALILLAGETRSQFYVVFFLIILMAGLTKSVPATLALACASSAAYGFLVGLGRPQELFDMEFTTRVAIFFVTAVFAGHLAEEAGRERRQHLRYRNFYKGLFDQSSDGIVVSDKFDVIREANRRACELLGSDPRGRIIWDVLGTSRDAALDAFPAGSGPAAEKSAPAFFSLEFKRPDGTTAACDLSFQRLRIEGDSFGLLLIRDVGEAKRLSKRMEGLEKESVLGQLIASITHEINNPLAVILGYAELLLETAPQNDSREYLEAIHEAGQRCKRVVDAFLDRHRSRPFVLVPTRLGDVVRGVVKLMDYHLRYHLVKVEVETADVTEVPADPYQIEQVLINLITNAVKSMEAAPQRALRLSVLEGEGENLIEVSDTGRGIPPENIGRIFERGFTATSDGSGHGLGLPLCQDIVGRHGGRITVESRVGLGTKFTVHLPRIGADTEHAAAPAASRCAPA